MGMMHFTSGKNGYEYWRPHGVEDSSEKRVRIPKAKLIEVLELEDKYRSSPEYQAKYSEKDELSWYRDVTLEIQKRALLETGLNEDEISIGLSELWEARGRWQWDPEVNQLTVYQRKDRSRRGELYESSDVPEVSLATMSHELTSLHAYCASVTNPHLPMFLIGGSVS